ncbi:adipocyte plasma membrane-associated protein Hemomucin [Aphomia sociella]
MGLIFGIIKRLIKLTIYFVVFAAIIVFIPNLPPYTKFTSIKLEPTLPRVGQLAPNGALNNAEKLYNGKLLGPEAFQLYNGEVYTTLATGEIVKLSPGGHVTFVTKIGQPCAGHLQDHICGRPLGIEIDEKKNLMYVADAYYGIWSVNLKTDKKTLLVSPRVAINGRQPKVFNSVALDKNGELYWTDSTSDFLLYDGVYSMVTDPSGRLFHYNAAKNESTMLLDNLWFANGIAISSDNQFVVVAETAGFKLRKYYINGPKKGQSEIFLAGIPGTPDNLRALPDGSGVLVMLYTVFDDEHPMLLKSMSETPLLRKFITRLVRLIEIPFEYLNSVYPHVFLEEIVYNIGNFKHTSHIQSGISGLLQVDWNGNIVASYFNTDGTFNSISDAIVYNDKIYIGAPHSTYVGAAPAPAALKKAFASKPSVKKTVNAEQAKPAKQAEQKPVQQAPKPTTTPPPKTTEAPKTTTQKPVEKKPAAKEAAKPTPKPSTAAPPQPSKPTPKPQAQQTPPKPATQKPVETKPKAEPPKVKVANTQPDDAKPKKTEPQKPVKENPPKPSANKPVPDKIKPITEEIPSDTVKPNKETLKVIKKDGPTEIPIPSV